MATLVYSSRGYYRNNILSLSPDFDSTKRAAIKLIDAICVSARQSSVHKLSLKNGKLFTPENKFVRVKR
jgi:hypothetical protein